MRTYTLVVGILFLVIGLAGLVPALAPVNEHGQLLLGIFQINKAQSLVHILTGLLALGALMAASGYYLSTYVRVFAVVYTLVALWGYAVFTTGYSDSVLFGYIHVNLATELVHIAVGLWGLYVGFFQKEAPTATTA